MVDPVSKIHFAPSPAVYEASGGPYSKLITPKAIIPPEMTTQVATVRHSASVFVKSQIAKMHATTQIRIQTVSTANETVRTKRGLMKPRLF
jgi:hypothetical protein